MQKQSTKSKAPATVTELNSYRSFVRSLVWLFVRSFARSFVCALVRPIVALLSPRFPRLLTQILSVYPSCYKFILCLPPILICSSKLCCSSFSAFILLLFLLSLLFSCYYSTVLCTRLLCSTLLYSALPMLAQTDSMKILWLNCLCHQWWHREMSHKDAQLSVPPQVAQTVATQILQQHTTKR